MPPIANRPRLLALTVAFSMLLLGKGTLPSATAQEPDAPVHEAAPTSEPIDPEKAAAEALAAEEPDDPTTVASDEPGDDRRIDLLWLLFQGGWLMLPILAMSFLVVAFGIERGLALRRSKILPPELIDWLRREAVVSDVIVPKEVASMCAEYPSSTANVLNEIVTKTGRKLTDVERDLSAPHQREADRLYANVRWLTLAAAVSPLMGLLGTVWGMINAFYKTANLALGANKAETLSEGIFIALVTTLAGLSVAIPAAVAAHFFETRIQRLLRELEETLVSVLPKIEAGAARHGGLDPGHLVSPMAVVREEKEEE